MEILPVIGNKQGSTEIQDDIMRECWENRILIINDEISDWLLEEAILHIFHWNRCDEDIPIEKRKPIRIVIDSEGGSVFAANNLIDIIKCSKTPIYSIGMSLVASAAFLIFISCHKRYGFKHTTYLQHDGSKSVSSSGSKARDFMNFLDKLDELDKETVLSNTKITSEEYDKRVREENFFMSDEAKEKGVIDGIIGVDVALDDIL